MTEPQPPGYVETPFYQPVHDSQRAGQSIGLPENTRQGLRGRLIESILQIVVGAITGIFTPGISAVVQLASWAADIAASIPIIGPILEWIASLFGIDIGDVGNPDVDFSDIWGGVMNIFVKPLNMFAELIGGLIPSGLLGILDPTKILGLPGLFTDVLTGFGNIFVGWFGRPSGAATVTEAIDAAAVAVEAIRASVAGGYTLQTFTASNASWSVPQELEDAAEAYAGVFGAGGRGGPGGGVIDSSDGVDAIGGSGGSSGGYRLEKIDPSTLASTLAVVIGVGASVESGHGGVTTITSGATVLAASVRNIGSITNPQGYIESASKPGEGGKGGDSVTGGNATTGENGEGTAIAAGPAGGGGSTNTSGGGGSATASNGAAGATGATSNIPLTGGTGGGGGGGASIRGVSGTARGGAGGNGGYPGGGSGGGGAVTAKNVLTTLIHGSPGAAPNGLAFLLWR